MMATKPARNGDIRLESTPRVRDNRGTTKDGPGSVGALWFRGLADWIGVD